jgi:hypothetical protein
VLLTPPSLQPPVVRRAAAVESRRAEPERRGVGGSGREAAAYLAKYREGIAGIGMSPEQMAAEYSAALRITPTRVRVC